MGYTHYFEGIGFLDDETLAEAKLIMTAAANKGIVIRGWDGNDAPFIEDGFISLNGDESTDNDYESFEIGRDKKWSFCKTARRPYDAVVGAILIAVKQHQPDAKITSDGNWDESPDWGEPRALYELALGKPAINPLD